MMVNAPGPVDSFWEDIARDGVGIPDEVWAAWNEAAGAPLNEIRALAGRAPGEPVPPRQAGAINTCVNRLIRSLKDLRRSDDSRNRVVDGKIFLCPAIKALMAHYVGNNLYKIALMADIYGENAAPLPAAVRGKVIKCLDAIGAFMGRLKAATEAFGVKAPELIMPRILIVDDEKDVRANIAGFLSQRIAGEIVQRSDGKEALELIDKEEFHVVLLDQNMPGIDGFTILEHVRHSRPLTVVIMITGLGGPAQSHKVERLGGIYMAKPIALKALQLTIERELDKRGGFNFRLSS